MSADHGYVGAYVPPGATVQLTGSGTAYTKTYQGYQVAEYYLHVNLSQNGSGVFAKQALVSYVKLNPGGLASVDFTTNFGSWTNTTGSDQPLLLDSYAELFQYGAAGISWSVQVTITGGSLGTCRTLNPVIPQIPLAQTFGGQCGCVSGSTGYQHLTSRPVNTATGSLYESFTDLAMPAPGTDLVFTRAYNSLDTTGGPLGTGWTYAFNASLSVDSTTGAVAVRAEDGKRASYPLVSGAYETPPGVRARLAAVPGGGYRLTNPDQSTLDFDQDGHLIAMKDRLGIGLILGYSSGKLATITDAAGRQVTVTFTGGMLTRLELADGRHVDYGYTNGRLTSVTDKRGKTTTYAYDTGGRLASALDPNGHYLFRNTYDPATGRVTSQLDPRGKQTTFGWNTSTQTATVTDPRGHIWTYKYSANVLRRETDPLGKTTTYGYDARLNRTSVTDARGKQTTMTYDTAGNMLTRTGPPPSSVQETWTYTPFNTIATYANGRGKTTTYEYFTDQLLKKKTDPLGRATTYTWTANGLIDTVTDPRGTVVDFGYDTAGNRTSMLSPEGNLTTYGYDAYGRQTTTVEARGNVSGANPAQYTTTITYNANDQVTTVTDPLGHQTTSGYDNAGNLATVTDADGKVTSYQYDADNRVTKVIDARGGETIRTYDDAGNVASVTTPAGTTTYTYDDANRVATTVRPRGNIAGATASAFTWTYTYDANGNQLTEYNPTAGTTTTTYDELNRPITVADAHSKITATTYDADSNITKVTDPLNRVTSYGYDDADQQISMTDPLGKVTTYGYDASGNQTSLTSPLGNTKTWSYNGDGLMTTQVDPRGNAAGATPSQYATTYAYDPAGRTSAVTDPLGHVTSYSYDRAGNLTARADARNHTTGYGYDTINRLTSVTDRLNHTTSYAYDPVGNLTTRTDANSHVTSYTYDLAGRLTKKTTPVGTWKYQYDPAGNLTTETNAGVVTDANKADGIIVRSYDALERLTGVNYSDATPDVTDVYDELHRTAMTDGDGTESYSYNAAGELTGVTRGTATYTYTYDSDGRVITRTVPDGRTITQTWDDDSRPTNTTTGGATTTYHYDPAGNRDTTSFGNAITEARQYDTAGRLSSLTTTRGSTVVFGQTLTRDANGNPTRAVRTYQGSVPANGDQTYTYDAEDRLTSVCSPSPCTSATSQLSYTYDPVGNRLTQVRLQAGNTSTSTYTYNTADQLTHTHTTATPTGPGVDIDYEYDKNGNQSAQDYTYVDYDLADHPQEVSGTQSATYAYDGDGLLSAAIRGGQTTTYSWDKNNPLPELTAETASAGTRTYLDDPAGDPVAITNPGTGAGTGVQYLHPDAIGSISAVTDSTGTTQATYDYDPFGATRVSPTNQDTLNNPIRFAGEYLDSGLQRYNLRARMYDPTTGRFNSLDPITQDVTDPYVSEYVYANNQPTVLTDPSGRCPMCVGALIGAGTDLGIQIALNIHNGCDPFYNINWGSVVASGLLGAFGGETFAQYLRFAKAAKSVDVVVPEAWNAATKLPSGGTVREVGNRIWGHGLPSPTRLAGMTDDELRALASLDDAKMLNAMYRGAGPAVPNNATAPIRVDLSQLVIDAWGRL